MKIQLQIGRVEQRLRRERLLEYRERGGEENDARPAEPATARRLATSGARKNRPTANRV
jgi:hypothetical protein